MFFTHFMRFILFRSCYIDINNRIPTRIRTYLEFMYAVAFMHAVDYIIFNYFACANASAHGRHKKIGKQPEAHVICYSFPQLTNCYFRIFLDDAVPKYTYQLQIYLFNIHPPLPLHFTQCHCSEFTPIAKEVNPNSKDGLRHLVRGSRFCGARAEIFYSS